MKKIFAVALIAAASSAAFAQTSKFEGWSATIGLGYQSAKPKYSDLTDTQNRAMTAEAGNSNGLVAGIGLEHGWALSSKYVLTAGLDYGLNYGGKGDINVYRGGALVGTERFQAKQETRIFLAPGWLIDNSTLGYFKLGYSKNKSKAESDGQTETTNAYTYGLGAKFMQSDDSFIYTEFNILQGKKEHFTGDISGDVKGGGYNIVVGYGKRF